MPRAERGFEHVEHTADLGIRAWGPTLADAFAEAARGLLAYMVEIDTVRPREARALEVEGGDAKHLLYQFLEEVRFLAETGFLVAEATVALDRGAVRAEVRGETFDAARHGHLHEVKAVTLHGIEVRPEGPDVFYVVDI